MPTIVVENTIDAQFVFPNGWGLNKFVGMFAIRSYLTCIGSIYTSKCKDIVVSITEVNAEQKFSFKVQPPKQSETENKIENQTENKAENKIEASENSKEEVTSSKKTGKWKEVEGSSSQYISRFFDGVFNTGNISSQ